MRVFCPRLYSTRAPLVFISLAFLLFEFSAAVATFLARWLPCQLTLAIFLVFLSVLLVCAPTLKFFVNAGVPFPLLLPVVFSPPLAPFANASSVPSVLLFFEAFPLSGRVLIFPVRNVLARCSLSLCDFFVLLVAFPP